jgi:hypothetical protein
VPHRGRQGEVPQACVRPSLRTALPSFIRLVACARLDYGRRYDLRSAVPICGLQLESFLPKAGGRVSPCCSTPARARAPTVCAHQRIIAWHRRTAPLGGACTSCYAHFDAWNAPDGSARGHAARIAAGRRARGLPRFGEPSLARRKRTSSS